MCVRQSREHRNCGAVQRIGNGVARETQKDAEPQKCMGADACFTGDPGVGEGVGVCASLGQQLGNIKMNPVCPLAQPFRKFLKGGFLRAPRTMVSSYL